MQCINCNVRLDRIRRHLLTNLSQALVDTIRFWTYPREITPSDYICHACWELADHSVAAEGTSTRRVGHHHVCVVCGRSILRMSRRRVIFQEPNEEEQRITNIISNWIQPQELSSQDEACIPCWLRAKRASRRSGQSEPQQMIQPEHVPDDGQSEIRTCCLCRNTLERNYDRFISNERQIMEVIAELMEVQQVPSISEVCSSCRERAEETLNSRVTVNEPQYIMLPNIRRAAETPGHCIFRGCTGSKRHVVPEDIRRRILIEYYYFIPRGARICNLHLHEEQYGDLYAAEYSLDTFSSNHIEEIVFILLEGLSNISYENIQNYPEHQVKYFIGLTKRQHQLILEATPSLRNLHRGSFALTALLCREHITTQRIQGVNPMLIRAKLKSRHSSGKTYFVFLVIERNVNGRKGIISYCCNCIVGLRTIGCCSHVMSIIWYLGYARHEGMTRPAPFLDEVILQVP